MEPKILVDNGIEYSFDPVPQFKPFAVRTTHLKSGEVNVSNIYLANARNLYCLLAHWNNGNKISEYTSELFTFPPTLSIFINANK